MRANRLLFVALYGVMAQCARGPAPVSAEAATSIAATCGPSGSTADVYSRLAPVCAGCHGSKASLPYFASLQSFRSLLLTDARFVVAGHPEQSGLLALLLGTAGGAYPEMPVGKGFQALEREKATLISTQEVSDWLKQLPESETKSGIARPDPNAATVRALRASELTHNLLDLLELTYNDFGASEASGNFFRDHSYFIYPVNALPIASDDWPGRLRFQALGGANYLGGTPASKEITASAVQVLLQASVRYCGVALPKLMKRATLNDKSTTNPGAIRENIRYLFLRLDGVDASPELVDEVYEGVYLPYEASGSAWTAVCSHLLQRPEALLL